MFVFVSLYFFIEKSQWDLNRGFLRWKMFGFCKETDLVIHRELHIEEKLIKIEF